MSWLVSGSRVGSSITSDSRSASLTGYPSGTFNRFETADVTGDGTSDIVSWRFGVLSIIELAAVRPAPPVAEEPTQPQ